MCIFNWPNIWMKNVQAEWDSGTRSEYFTTRGRGYLNKIIMSLSFQTFIAACLQSINQSMWHYAFSCLLACFSYHPRTLSFGVFEVLVLVSQELTTVLLKFGLLIETMSKYVMVFNPSPGTVPLSHPYILLHPFTGGYQ